MACGPGWSGFGASGGAALRQMRCGVGVITLGRKWECFTVGDIWGRKISDFGLGGWMTDIFLSQVIHNLFTGRYYNLVHGFYSRKS
jgi:hypothetical protein